MAKLRQLKKKSAAMAPRWSKARTTVVIQFSFWRLERLIISVVFTQSPVRKLKLVYQKGRGVLGYLWLTRIAFEKRRCAYCTRRALRNVNGVGHCPAARGCRCIPTPRAGLTQTEKNRTVRLSYRP